ncbi:MAG: hypothetical protein KGI51_03725 [Rhodospirillales bacterium]|nr:hypothetical protein [Rhodospirillales bacterium]
MSGIAVAPLQAVEIDLAYPLARQAVPGLSWADWRRHARAALAAAPRGRGGIMAARREGRAHPGGLVCWRRESELGGGAVLVASHFVALDILDPAPVLAALVAAVEREAAALGCRAVRARIAADCDAVGRVLAEAGLRREGAEMVKGVERPAAAVS